MKKILFLLIISFVSLAVFGQNFNMSNATVNVDCTTGGTLFDSGGNGSTYSNNENFVITICPGSPGFGVFTTMDVMDIATGDQIMVYNGNSTAAPTYPDMPLDENTNYGNGAQFQSTVSNTSGCLTFEFISNGDGTVGNFEFGLSCEPRCQEVISYIGFADPDTVHENGEVYINICPGDTLDISGNANFPENNTEYAQSEATSIFSWNWGDNTPNETGQNQTHYYPAPGGYLLTLNVEDINGCINYQDQVIKVRVAPEPIFDTLVPDTTLCLNGIDTLTARPLGELLVTGDYIIGDTQFFQPPLFSGDSIFLPDGNGAGYNTSVNISSFPSNATIQNCGDILEVCINMEHSYLGDLEISLTCPSGQTAILKEYPGGGGTYLGNALDDGTTNPGQGLEYCFSPAGTGLLVNGPTQAGTLSVGQTKVPGLYAPVDPFTTFVGCPINGQWTLNITDNLTIDNGYIFNWQLNFDQCQYPQIDSFYMIYGLGHWEPHQMITGINVDSNSIIVEPDTLGVHTLTYVIEDQFGCKYSNDYNVLVEGFDVIANPQDTTICEGESVQLNATVDGETITCETDYLVYEIPYNKEEGTLIPFNFSNANNGASQAITMPFPFRFYCANSTSVRAYTDGYISFLNTGASIPNNAPFPTAVMPNSLIALMWDDLVDSASASGYFVSGTAPYRKMVIDFDLVHNGGTPATEPVKGQIILYETTNMIDILCENCQQDADDPTASQGMENFTGAYGSFTPGRNSGAWSATNSAWRYYPQSSLNTDYTVFWTPNATLVGDSTQAPFATPLATTDYIVDIKRNDNSCNYKDTVTVNVIPHFSYNFANDTSICSGQSVQLNVTGNATNIAWTPNDGTINDTTIFNPTITPDSSSAYYALLDSAGYCPTLDTVNILFIEQVIVDTTIVTNPPCNGAASIEIILDTASSPAQFSIDG
ncbi:MAG: proprotein convertase P-domain-containing protein, partial [Chitinophagales bacterium]|nr:proprotein convertase P-domain-containing protein [Chitinophagales bacterium]